MPIISTLPVEFLLFMLFAVLIVLGLLVFLRIAELRDQKAYLDDALEQERQRADAWGIAAENMRRRANDAIRARNGPPTENGQPTHIVTAKELKYMAEKEQEPTRAKVRREWPVRG